MQSISESQTRLFFTQRFETHEYAYKAMIKIGGLNRSSAGIGFE